MSRVRHSRISLQRSKSLLLLLPFGNDDASFLDNESCSAVLDEVASGVFVKVVTALFVEVASNVLEDDGERFPWEDAAVEWDPPFRTL